MRGYEAALTEAGYPVLGELKFQTRNEIEYTRNMLVEYSRTLSFDSVISTADAMAVGAVKYAKIKGILVPEELSVVGYNNSLMSVSCEPEMTSVDSKVDVLCRKTVENMIGLLEHGERPAAQTLVPCDIVKRCTTDFAFE